LANRPQNGDRFRAVHNRSLARVGRTRPH
jgi:hypothetical protein